MIGRCELCGREKDLNFHHLIPQKLHSKKKFIRQFGKAELKRRGLNLCKLCHDGLHDLVPNEKVLGEKYNTKEALLAEERIVRHIEWVKKQK